MVTGAEAYGAGIAIRGETVVAIGPDDLPQGADRETLPRSFKRQNEEVAEASVVDFPWHFILHNDPHIFVGLPEAL